jgi:hypothetical protein
MHGFNDCGAVVADIHAPEPCESIKETPIVLIDEKTSVTRLDQVRARLVHVGVMSKGVEVELTIEIAQFGN